MMPRRTTRRDVREHRASSCLFVARELEIQFGTCTAAQRNESRRRLVSLFCAEDPQLLPVRTPAPTKNRLSIEALIRQVAVDASVHSRSPPMLTCQDAAERGPFTIGPLVVACGCLWAWMRLLVVAHRADDPANIRRAAQDELRADQCSAGSRMSYWRVGSALSIWGNP